MSKIKMQKNNYLGDRIWVKNQNYDMYYRRNPGKKKGRILGINLGYASMTLNGTQINTIKRILEEAGEIK